MTHAYILDAVRTPRGRGKDKGALSGIHSQELLAQTLNRLMESSGVEPSHLDDVVVGGVESMSRVPMGSDRAGVDGNNPFLRERVVQVPQGISADLIATLEGISRAEIDAFALESQRRAARAQEEGRFDKSLFPVKDPAPAAPPVPRAADNFR